jgi:hypothetical protein
MVSPSITQPLRPHCHEWFRALNASSPQQANHTAQVIKLMGSEDVCSICGDKESTDYHIQGSEFEPGTAATIRLCDHCKTLRENGVGATFVPLS